MILVDLCGMHVSEDMVSLRTETKSRTVILQLSGRTIDFCKIYSQDELRMWVLVFDEQGNRWFSCLLVADF